MFARVTEDLFQLGDLKGKRVLVRSDFNVPLDADKNITDDGRIQAALPTLRTLIDAGAKIIIVAHLGRPKGQVNPDYSLAPVAKRLAEVTGVKVTLAEDTVGESAKAAVAAAGDGEIVLLENVRFNAAETSKDDAEREAFAAELAALADVFVSDGFGVVHRKQASVYDVAKLLPSAAGLLVVKEIESLGRAVNDPERPYTVVLGGSTDNEFTKLAWRRDHADLDKLPIWQFADNGGKLARALGVLDEEEGVALRATFVVDPHNVIQHVYVTNLNVGRAPEDTLRVVDALQTDELCACNRPVGGETLAA